MKMRIMCKIMSCSFCMAVMALFSSCKANREAFPKLSVATQHGESVIAILINHGSLLFEFRGKEYYIDPVEVTKKCSYDAMPKADYVFITHKHFDHFNEGTIKKISTVETKVFVSENTPTNGIDNARVLANGSNVALSDDVAVYAVPAYNTTQGRLHFHPKGEGNGYVFDFDGCRIYVSGDTEDVEEMSDLKGVDVAFIAVNQPYTMTPEQCAKAGTTIAPKMLIPYHMGTTSKKDLMAVLSLMQGKVVFEECLR